MEKKPDSTERRAGLIRTDIPPGTPGRVIRMKTCRDFTVVAAMESLSGIATLLEDHLRECGVGEKEIFEIGLAVDEACANIILYGYREEGGSITISSCVQSHQVEVTISDRGTPFDPLSVPPPDIAADVDHRKIGGLGIHLIRSMTDQVSYHYQDGTNLLTLVKERHTAGCG
jgi:serine/threonine-protein kinase RsbW